MGSIEGGFTMYIEFLSPSPKATQQEHMTREIGAALITAGFAKEVAAPSFQVQPAPVSFGVFKGSLEATPTALFCRCNNSPCNGRTDHYIGKPDAQSIAQGFTARLCVHAKAEPLPAEILAAYRAAYKPSPYGWSTGTPGIAAQQSPAQPRGRIDARGNRVKEQ
jgi:hypothetical protein